MYNENSNFSIKNVIIQFLFIALFIFLLVWLFPLKSDIKNLNSEDNNLSVLADRIFNENIKNVLGNGMVINPLALMEEWKTIRSEGFACNNLYIT